VHFRGLRDRANDQIAQSNETWAHSHKVSKQRSLGLFDQENGHERSFHAHAGYSPY
jgi:hypothetical protein